MSDPCPICYDAVPNVVVCEHSHCLCQTCYDRMMSDARSQNKKCAECRAPMFQWNDGTQDPVVADRARAVAPAGAPLLGAGLTYNEARVLASRMFYQCVDGGMNARSRNALIRHNFPILWQGRRTFSVLSRAQVAQNPAPAQAMVAPPARPRAPPRCSRCHQLGHNRSNRSCPMHPRPR